MSFAVIILAAGNSKRMQSTLPKTLHEIAGQPLLGHVTDAAIAAGADDIAIVVNPDHQQVIDFFTDKVPSGSVYYQKQRLGTAHALAQAIPFLVNKDKPTIVMYGDSPLISSTTIRSLFEKIKSGQADMAVLGFTTDNPGNYGRLLVDDYGQLLAITEASDASPAELAINRCNSGIMAFAPDLLPQIITAVKPAANGEYYLTGAAAIINQRGLTAVVVEGDESEVIGVNNRVELAQAEAVIQQRLRQKFMAQGVTLIAPETVFFTYDTQIASDVIIEPYVTFGAGVSIGSATIIKSFCAIEQATIDKQANIGPFARLRPGAKIGYNAKIGNFCEVKQASIDANAKINHLSYIGDAEVGTDANVGAGTICCNYDGLKKNKTIIGNGSFIGSNSALVAPVTIGNNAYVGAGSVITEDVPDNAMAIGRARQVIKAKK